MSISSNPNERSFLRLDARVDPQARLVCFPHAGGNAGSYRDWSRAFPIDVELVGVRYPRSAGHPRRSFSTIDDLAAVIEEAIGPALGESVPLVFFGHSLGALVAYEVTRRMEKRGSRAVARLVVSGQPAPGDRRDENKSRMSDDELWDEVRSLGGTSEDVLASVALRRLLLPRLRHDYRLTETYVWQPGPSLECPVTACVGDCDPEASVQEVARWRGYTAGAFDMRIFPGDHFYFGEDRSQLLAEMSRLLQAVSSTLKERRRASVRESPVS